MNLFMNDQRLDAKNGTGGLINDTQNLRHNAGYHHTGKIRSLHFLFMQCPQNPNGVIRCVPVAYRIHFGRKVNAVLHTVHINAAQTDCGVSNINNQYHIHSSMWKRLAPSVGG